MSTISSVVKRSGAIVDFKPQRISNAIYRAAVAVGGRNRELAEQLSIQVVQSLEASLPAGHIPTVEEVQDVVEKILIENGHAKVAKAYILYREERAQERRQRARLAAAPPGNIPWHKIWHVLDWAVSHGVHSVKTFNDRVARGELNDIILESEAAYEEDVENAVEMIAARGSELKVVIIVGPSSSGKTTTAIKVRDRLKQIGLNLVTLTVDNYFFDLDSQPKDEFNDYDFETPQAIDLALVNQHLTQLVAGETAQIPIYDFKTGQRLPNTTPLKLGAGDLLLLDSLHGLYPEMTQSVSDAQKFKLYIEPLLQMKGTDQDYVRWTDLRLIRRMLRDAVHRSYNPQQTIEHWHYVRKSEKRNIFPYLPQADYIINSGMPYELSIYRSRMLAKFEDWASLYRDDPLRQDAFQRASRVAALLQTVVPMGDESGVPASSVLREFIGGSCYEG